MKHTSRSNAGRIAWTPLATLFAVTLTAGACAAWSVHATAGGPPAAPSPGPTTLTVSSATATSTAWPRQVQASGAVVAREEIGIAAEVGDVRILQLRVDVGDSVVEGQLLAQLDDAALKAQEAELSAELRRAAAAWRQARATLERSSALDAGAAISPHDLEQHRAQADTAEAEHEMVAARLALKRLQLRRTQVRAPHGGVISSRTALAGSVTAVGQELFRVLRDNRLEWRAELTAAQLSQVQPRRPVMLQLPDGSSAQGTVRQLAPTVGASSRLGLAYVDIAPGSRVRAGMYAAGSIDAGAAPALVLPASAVAVRDGRSMVAKLGGAGEVRRVSIVMVQVGRRLGTEVEVTAGLQAGDPVVRHGAGLLGEGDLVRVVPLPPPPAAAASGGAR